MTWLAPCIPAARLNVTILIICNHPFKLCTHICMNNWTHSYLHTHIHTCIYTCTHTCNHTCHHACAVTYSRHGEWKFKPPINNWLISRHCMCEYSTNFSWTKSEIINRSNDWIWRVKGKRKFSIGLGPTDLIIGGYYRPPYMYVAESQIGLLADRRQNSRLIWGEICV